MNPERPDLIAQLKRLEADLDALNKAHAELRRAVDAKAALLWPPTNPDAADGREEER